MLFKKSKMRLNLEIILEISGLAPPLNMFPRVRFNQSWLREPSPWRWDGGLVLSLGGQNTQSLSMVCGANLHLWAIRASALRQAFGSESVTTSLTPVWVHWLFFLAVPVQASCWSFRKLCLHSSSTHGVVWLFWGLAIFRDLEQIA